MTCDLLLHNGQIPNASTADSVAVAGERILAVGPLAELRPLCGHRTRRIDLKEGLITPGLWDGHIHLYHWSRARRHLNLKGCRDADEVLHRVRQVPHAWVVGWHLNSSCWKDETLPTRHDLDQACAERPVILWLSDLHSAVANTVALENAGLMASNPAVAGGVVEVDVKGQPTGVLREMAANLVRDSIPEPDPSELRGLLEDGIRELNSLGVTAVCEQRIKDLDEGGSVFRALRELETSNRLNLRVACNVAAHNLEQAARLGLSTGFGTTRLRVGHLKVFSDGTLGSKTARMLQPLLGEEQCGLYLTPPDEMEETFRRACELGFSVSVHSIGDESTRVCLDIFSSMQKDGVREPAMPHRLEHAQVVSDADVPRFAELGVTVSAQPGHALDDKVIAERFLGPRARLGYRFGDFYRSGALMAFGTDGPVSEVDPRYGLQSAVHRALAGEEPWFPGQRLSFSEAIGCYTEGAASSAGWSRECGLLESGTLADLVVWSKGFDRAENFFDGSVMLTVSGGRVVYEDGLGQE